MPDTPPHGANLVQLWHTIRHLRPEQALARARLRGAAALRRAAPHAAVSWYGRLVARAALVHRPGRSSPFTVLRQSRDELPGHREVARRYLAGDVEYLSSRRAVGSPRGWPGLTAPRLFRYHLQYFDELPDAALASHPDEVVAFLRTWIAAHPLGVDHDAWHPYVVSMRCVNWILAAAVLEARGTAVPADVLHQMRCDAVFVSRNLESDVGGNHLLKNLKALAFASVWWAGPQADDWRRHAAAGWVRELARQVLGDGGHYELSPMYHCQVLGDLLETIAVFGGARIAVPHSLITAARRMTAFLDIVCHPDGDIALFNDSALGAAAHPATLRRMAGAVLDGGAASDLPVRLRLLAEMVTEPLAIDGADAEGHASGSAGFFRLDSSDQRLAMIADAGAVCPDDLPAHAHSDLLSFEASVEGRRVIVDSGVADYEAGQWRDFWRSTRAHNTVVVDGAEQSECWGSFRVARRARPIGVRQQHDPDLHALTASHTGYLRLRPSVEHRRTIALIRDGFWIVIDELFGSGRHSWDSILHFHPRFAVNLGESGAQATADGVAMRVAWTAELRSTCIRGGDAPLQGWYGPRFGVREPATALLLSGSGELPVRFACVLVPQSGVQPLVSWEAERQLAIQLGSEMVRVLVPGSTERERVLTVR